MLGVNLEEQPEAVEGFAKAYNIPFPLLLDRDGRVQKLFGLRGHPSTALIDRKGRIVGRIQGERNWDGPEARRLVRWLLESEDGG
jgi:peroxiredoxin